MNGVNISRDRLHAGVLKNHALNALLDYCLLMAVEAPCTVTVCGQPVELMAGQFVASRTRFMEDLNMGEQTVRTCLRQAIKLGQLTRHLTSKLTNGVGIITVTNWHSYTTEIIEANQPTNQPTNQGKPVKKTRKKEAPQPAEIPPVIETLRKATERYPNKKIWPSLIEYAATLEPIKHDLLEQKCREWMAQGWNPSNYLGMLKYYSESLGGKQNESGKSQLDNVSRECLSALLQGNNNFLARKGVTRKEVETALARRNAYLPGF